VEKQALEAGKRKMGPPRKGVFLATRDSETTTIKEKGNNLQKGEPLPSVRPAGNVIEECVCLHHVL